MVRRKRAAALARAVSDGGGTGHTWLLWERCLACIFLFHNFVLSVLVGKEVTDRVPDQ